MRIRRAFSLLLGGAVACGGAATQRATVVPAAAVAASAGASVGPRPLEIHPTARSYRIDPKRSRFEIFGTDIFGVEHRMTFATWQARVTFEPAPRITARIETASVVVDFPGATGTVKSSVLEVERFPFATLDATLARTEGPAAEHVVEGVADLHGVQKTLRFFGTLTAEGDAYRFTTSFVVSRKDFAIRYAPVEPFLRDDARVVIDALARPERVEAEEVP